MGYIAQKKDVMLPHPVLVFFWLIVITKYQPVNNAQFLNVLK